MKSYNLFHIRPLVAGDIPAVVQIEQASRPSPWSTSQFSAELSNTNSWPLVLINTQNEYLIGYVIPWIVAGEIQIQNIVIAQAHRGQRLGKLLLNVALTAGLNAGCDQAILEVRKSNQAAISLYQQYQFEIVGRRENYYHDGETALLMTAGPFAIKADLVKYREFVSKKTTELQDKLQFQVVNHP
ncbi:MAG: ribosomal-protein-alanine N-acetyltransferase [Cellvibrionaceae bacterium]|jgi:ribosomal-protein-alanine N-acetyltransferase